MEYDTYVLEEAARTVYERPEQHGEPEDTFGLIARFWNIHLEQLGAPSDLLSSVDVAKMFIDMKMARSLNGHYDEDNPCDVAGYAENWARLEKQKEKELEYQEADKTAANRGVWDAWRSGHITEAERDSLLNYREYDRNN